MAISSSNLLSRSSWLDLESNFRTWFYVFEEILDIILTLETSVKFDRIFSLRLGELNPFVEICGSQDILCIINKFLPGYFTKLLNTYI